MAGNPGGDSPLGKVAFEALGKSWTLRYGYRQRHKAEQEFGCGFIGVFLQMIPGISIEQVMAGDTEALEQEVNIAGVKIGGLAVLFACGLGEPATDDEVDAMVEELGIERITELVISAVEGSSPPPEPEGTLRQAQGERGNAVAGKSPRPAGKSSKG